MCVCVCVCVCVFWHNCIEHREIEIENGSRPCFPFYFIIPIVSFIFFSFHLFIWKTNICFIWLAKYNIWCCKYFPFFLKVFNLWRPLLMIVFYYQVKTPINFLCRRGLNFKSLIFLNLYPYYIIKHVFG